MPGTRASDADRDSCLEDIEAAFADGRINDAERESRTQSALQAKTLQELSALVADLRPPPGTPTSLADLASAPAMSGKAVRSVLVVTAVAAVAAIAIWIVAANGGDDAGPVGQGSSPTEATPVAQQQPLKNKLALHTAAGFAKFVSLTKDRFGTTLVESAALYPDYASVNIATKADPRHTERWYFAKGYEGDPSKGTRPKDDPMIDMAQVDTGALVRAIKRAPSVLGVENVDTTYVILNDWDGEPAFWVYVSNEYHETGFWTFSLEGKELYRYAFE
jgi:hypothetical protein